MIGETVQYNQNIIFPKAGSKPSILSVRRRGVGVIYYTGLVRVRLCHDVKFFFDWPVGLVVRDPDC